MQFQELTNKFEEINFKLDNLSTKLSKVQQDNQIRFEQIENSSNNNTNKNALTSLPKTEQKLGNEEVNQKKSYLVHQNLNHLENYLIKI